MSAPIVIDLSVGRQRSAGYAAAGLTVVAVLALGYGLLGDGSLARHIVLDVAGILLLSLAAAQWFGVRGQRGRHVLRLTVDAQGLAFEDRGAAGTGPVTWTVGWAQLVSIAVVRQIWPDAIVPAPRVGLGRVRYPGGTTSAPGYNPVARWTVLLDLCAHDALEARQPVLSRFRVPDPMPRYRIGLGPSATAAGRLAAAVQQHAPALFAGQQQENTSAGFAAQPVWDPHSRTDRLL